MSELSPDGWERAGKYEPWQVAQVFPVAVQGHSGNADLQCESFFLSGHPCQIVLVVSQASRYGFEGRVLGEAEFRSVEQGWVEEGLGGH